MKKHWIVGTPGNTVGKKFETLEEAVEGAKRKASDKGHRYDEIEAYVYEAVQLAKAPVPNIEMTVL